MSDFKSKRAISFRLNPLVIDLLEKISSDTGMSKTAVIEKAITDFEKRYDKDLEMDIRKQIDEIHEIVTKFTVVGIPVSIDKRYI